MHISIRIYIWRYLCCYLTQNTTHPYGKNRARGGSLSLFKSRVWGDYCEFPYENIGFYIPPALRVGSVCVIYLYIYGI